MDRKLPKYPPNGNTNQIQKPTLVWDLPLRLFHWSMVGVVVIAAISGFLAPEWWLDLHIIVGFALSILLTFRIAWGFLGNQYSRFKNFPLTFSGVRQHLHTIIHKESHDYVGHNPVGAWMIIVLLLVLALLVATGLMVLGGQENLGPLASATPFHLGDLAGKAHQIAAWGLVGAVIIHLLGVFVETRIFRHPVLRAMITGEKMTARPPNAPTGTLAFKGSALFLAISVVLLGGGSILANNPPSGWRAVQVPEAYSSECGDCHHAYHSSLRSKEAWSAMVMNLSDHFGEDASLDEETAKIINSYLKENSAETFDTEVAQRVGRTNSISLRMTDTPYWKQRHQDIKGAVFRLSAVKSKVNCVACHKDAASGQFDDIKIHLPVGDKK